MKSVLITKSFITDYTLPLSVQYIEPNKNPQKSHRRPKEDDILLHLTHIHKNSFHINPINYLVSNENGKYL